MDILAVTRTAVRTSYYDAADLYEAAGLTSAAMTGALIAMIIGLVIGLVINMALTWGVYKKAGYKGWEGVVPFYNTYLLYKMSDVSIALFIVSIFIPIVNIYMYFELAKKFGKEAIWGLGLFFLGFIFMPILGYGEAKFQGTMANGSTAKAEKSETK